MLSLFEPYFAENAKSYRKFARVLACIAKEGQRVETITSDGLETFNIAREGDYLVQNLTDASELYLVPKDKFEKRYSRVEQVDENSALYQSTTQISALELTEGLIQTLSLPQTIYFIAPWNEQMVAKQGDFLAIPQGATLEIYRIAAKEFNETYRVLAEEE